MPLEFGFFAPPGSFQAFSADAEMAVHGSDGTDDQQEIEIQASCQAHGCRKQCPFKDLSERCLVHDLCDPLCTRERQHIDCNVNRRLEDHDTEHGFSGKPHAFVDQPGHKEHAASLDEGQDQHKGDLAFMSDQKYDRFMVLVRHLDQFFFSFS